MANLSLLSSSAAGRQGNFIAAICTVTRSVCLARLLMSRVLVIRSAIGFRQPGYIPETLFYVMFGQPERVYLRDPIMAADGERSHV